MDATTRRALMKSNPEIAPNCPRCASSNTKFCYYNNYSLSQPRYFCKGCRRYWTKGGSLRNVPVGGGCRKSRRGRSSRPLTSSTDALASYISRSDGDRPLMPQDANNLNGQDIDMAAVFAKFLDPNSETEPRDPDQETDHSKDDDLFFELTSSLGSNNNEGENFLMDCNNSTDTGLLGQEVMQEFITSGDEIFETSYDASSGLEYLLSDQVIIPSPEATWPRYGDTDAFCHTVVSQEECPSIQFPVSDDFNQMKGSGNNIGLVDDHNWRVGSCFDVTSYV